MNSRDFMLTALAVFAGTLAALGVVFLVGKSALASETSSLSQTTLGKLLGL